jgi:hypothetical protein
MNRVAWINEGANMWKNSQRVTRQLPSKAFRFKWEAIEPGDIICSTIPSNLVSGLIRTLTWSDFSHVSLCVEKKGCIEANESVARFSLLRVGCLNPSNVKVLRLRDDAVANAQSIRESSAKEALKFLALPYWTQGTFRALFQARPIAQQPGAFCSHLVASAYKNAGYDLIPGINPQHVSPKAISESPCFVDITANVIEEIPAQHIGDYLEFIDAARSVDTPHLWEVAIGLDVCSDVANSFQALAGQRPRSLPEAQKIIAVECTARPEIARQLDEWLTASMVKHNFVEQLRNKIPRKPFYDPDQLAAWLFSDGAENVSNIQHVIDNCLSIDHGSDAILQDRLADCQAYQHAALAGLSFAQLLEPLTREIYEAHQELVEKNRICLQILQAASDGRNFIPLVPGGDPRDNLTRAAGEEGVFVLRAVEPVHPARKYAGKLMHALREYAKHVGASESRVAVEVCREVSGQRIFVPPPPLEEGAWMVQPFVYQDFEVEDLGEVEV